MPTTMRCLLRSFCDFHILRANLLRAFLPLIVAIGIPALSEAADLSKDFSWKPVRIGAGGFVSGLVIHPADPAIRYCRTDVGNAYRWDDTAKEWLPMVVFTGSGGIPAGVAAAPFRGGVEALAIDPNDKNLVLMALTVQYSSDLKLPGKKGTVFRSTDGGRTFAMSDLDVKMNSNGNWRNRGERMGVDPNDGRIVFYGSSDAGLWKSVNGGLNWTPVTGGGAPDPSSHVIGVRFDRVDDSHTTVYAVVAGEGILKSVDGGANWTDVSAGSGIAGAPGNSTIDHLGNLYVAKEKSREFWKMSREGIWTKLATDFGSSGNQANGIAVDPANLERMFAIGTGGALTRSLDGGATWQRLGNFLKFEKSLGWLPQKINGSPDSWRSNAGIFFDSDSRLWVPQGNEGVLTYKPSDDNTESAESPPHWTIDSKGIEEFVTHDVVILPGSGDHAVVSVEDATAFLVQNPDSFSAIQATLQDQLISNGLGLAVCPNDSKFVAVASADVNHTRSGKDYSGYSTDGGRTWTRFASAPPGAMAGSLAVSRREGWGEGSDHIVWYPTQNRPPYWSTDGGKTWTASKGFPLKENGTFDRLSGYWIFALKQRALAADPSKADRFLLYMPWKGYFLSEDGGKEWTSIPHSNLPEGGHHAQIAPNPHVPGQFWFADGWEGAGDHGLWLSEDGGLTYEKIDNVAHAVTLAVGKGRSSPGAIYFYGRLVSDSAWGIFRSEDKGATWDRLSYYPFGLVDIPTCMAASQDTPGLVYVGFSGNTCVYGQPITPAAE